MSTTAPRAPGWWRSRTTAYPGAPPWRWCGRGCVHGANVWIGDVLVRPPCTHQQQGRTCRPRLLSTPVPAPRERCLRMSRMKRLAALAWTSRSLMRSAASVRRRTAQHAGDPAHRGARRRARRWLACRADSTSSARFQLNRQLFVAQPLSPPGRPGRPRSATAGPTPQPAASDDPAGSERLQLAPAARCWPAVMSCSGSKVRRPGSWCRGQREVDLIILSGQRRDRQPGTPDP